jgi:3-oxoacyl-[acyl-carrier protein] reductase
VAPGFIDTTRTKAQVGAARQVNVARTPAGRLGTPEEVAATVAFLASDDAAFFVGATVSPNGGLVTAV